MPNTAPPYTIGGITRPALIFDNAGNIILTPEAAAFQAAYGTKALYAGLPANTPYPPVAATLSAPLDNNGGINSVLENAAVGTQTGITVQANNNGGPPVTYSLTDNAGGRFQINATTGVVTVAAALDFETAPSQAYNITVQANDGIFSTSQTFTIGVGNVNEAPAGTNNTITASEDTNRVFTSADFGFTDPSDSVLPNTLAAVRITTLPAAGTLLNNGVAVAAGDSISAADIAAGHLVFVPAANANGAGYASFTFQVRDNGGTANGGVDTDQSPNTMTINVTAVNDAPTATNLTQSLVINEDAAATQLFSVAPAVADIDSGTVTATLTLDVAAGVLVGAGAGVLNGTVLTYTITGSPAAVNTALAAVTYDSAANFHGTASVGIAVTDGANGPQGTNPTGTISITVNSVNDAPAGTNNTITASEDTNRVFTAADFGFSDTSDSPANALDAVRITTLPAAGTLLNNGNPVSAGGFVSVADINGGHLVFVPAANASGTGYASFTFQVRDDGGTASGGFDTDASANTITIDVNAVNDAPTATGLTQPLTISEDAAATTLFTVAPAVGDIDSASVTATLTLDAAAGVLVGAGAGVLNAGVLTYTITGAAAAVNTALASVTFDSANDFNGSTGVGITIDDGGNGPQGTNPTGTVSINVTAVNDAPIATNLTQSLTISEDAAATTLFTLPPVASDIDSATVTATLTLDPAAGVLNGAGSSVLVGGLLTYTITGTPAAVNAALAAVTYDSPPDFNGTASVGVTIDDGANGPQGTNPTGTISITVDAVNDAPVATNLTQSLVINEDDGATTLFTLAPLVTDVDSGTVTATLTLDAAAGFLVGAGPGALNAGVLTYTITGSPLTVSNALALVAFDSADDFNGITDVGITISDGANGPQGSNPIGTGTVTINAVNDAPTATNLTQSLSVGEDGAAATLFTLAPVVADVDSSNVTATLTLDPAAGVLTGAGTGVLALGVLTYTITGTPAAVNAALAAVTYDSAPDFFGSSNVGVTIDDGGAGPQGTNPTGTVSITVTAVNDAPTATNLSQSLTIDEDAAATTLFALPPVTADIDSANVTARLTLDAAAGVLNGAGAGVLALGVLTYTITGTPAAVNAALAAVTYDSAPDFFGSPNVGVAIDDGANGPQGTNPTGTIGITVNPVNDAPTLAATAVNPAYVPGADLFSGVTASTVESGQTIVQLVLTVTNISDTESLLIDGATVALVDGTVSGSPTATLGVSYSVAVSGGTATITITSPGLTGAQTGTLVDALSYTNADVDSGELPRVVTIVSLTDDGGTLLGGVATGTPGIASTVNFNVPPTIAVDGVVNYVENDGPTFIDSTITVGDADDTHMESATVAITSGYAAGEDVLSFTNSGGITGNLVGNTLTATGHATLAEYQTFLGSVRYQNTSNDPTVSDRIVTYTVNDGSVDSAPDTATIHVAPRNDEPTLSATAANPGFTENGAAADLFSSPVVSTVEAGQTLNQIIVTVTNVAGTGATESLLIDGTTVELSNGNSELTATNGMTASVALAGGTATVTISRASGISTADMTTLVDNLAYGNTSQDPGNASRVVTVTSLRDDGLNGGGNDNINSTLAVASTVTVTPVNDEPTLTATANGGGAVTFTETSLPAFAGSGPVDLFSSPVTSTVEAGQTVTQVVLSVTNVADTTEYLTIGATVVDLVNGNSEAVLVGGAAGTATVSITAGVATITVTPTTTFSAANVNALVDSLAYSNDDNTPTATTHTISVTSLTDSGANGGGNDNTGSPSVSTVVTVVATNDAPVAVNDTFTGVNGAITNTALVVDGPTAGTADPDGVQKVITGNILANDADSDGGPLSVVGGTFATAQGGTVTLDTDGGFVYVPKPNTDGTVDTSDSFTYTVSDGQPGGTATATVTINFVPNSTIWYVDASYAGANGASDGSSLRPFTDFTQLNGVGGAGDVDAAGDTIFVADGTVTGNLELESGQKLYGERHGLDAPDGGGAAGITTLLAANAGAGLTQINGTITAATGGNNDIQAISWGSSAGVSLTGTNVGALHVNDANAASAGSINNTTAGAVSINGSTAGMNLQFTSASSGAGATGISLTNALGTFNATGGTLSGHTGSEISISGGTGTINYAGTLGDGTGDSAQINNRTGGTVTLSGNINDSNDAGGGIGVSGNANTTINFTGSAKVLNTGIGDGVSMTNNTGTSNVNFTGGGLDIDTTNGTGFRATVAGTYSVTGSGNSITTNGNGAALNLDTIIVASGAGGGITFDSTSSTNSTGTAVAIDTVTGGAIALGTGSISGSDGDAFRVGDGAGTANTGGTSAITYAGTISKTDGTGQAVDIQDRAAGAGNITLSGNITHNLATTGILLDDNAAGTITFSGSSKAITSTTATAVNLTDNAGATIAFTNGGLVINTTAGNGFNATGAGPAATTGGTVTVEGSGNTITSTTGTALNVVHTTIGANDLTFQSISSSGAVNGIVLNNTGALGGLTVTGTGGASSNGSGGQILASTGAGISLNSTSSVSLGYMNINNGLDDGIHGESVSGFTLNRSNVNNNGNSTSDDGIQFGLESGATVGLTGAVSITNSSVSGNAHNNVHIRDTSGTISSLTVTGSSFNNLNDTFGANSFLFEGSGTSVLTSATFSGNTVQNNSPQRGLEVQAHDTATVGTFTVSGNTFIDNGIQASFTQDGSANLTFKFLNNGTAGTPMTGSILQAVNVFSSSQATGGTIVGTISDNFIGNAAVINSGSTQGGGISATIQGQTDATLLIDGNNIQQTFGDSRGIYVGVRGPANPLAGTLGANTVVSDVTITDNIVTPGNTANNFGAAIVVEADNQTGADNRAPTVRADIHGNTVPLVASRPVNGEFFNAHIIFFEYTSAGAAGIGQLVDTAPASANATAQLTSTNTGTSQASAGITLIAGPIGTPPLTAAPGGVQALIPTPGETHLTQGQLDSVVAAAIAQWAAAGASAAQLALLAALTVTVADLTGDRVGEQTPGHILIDPSAAGHGWFVDSTPNDNSEFSHAANAAGTDLDTDPTNAAAGHLDLLTAVSHEMGHALGLDDKPSPTDAHDLMYINLVDGERRLPDAGDVAQASAGPAQTSSVGQASLLPIIRGTAGNDTIDAGHGGNILVGEAGADHFVFASVPAPTAPTHVADYSFIQGDSFDFSALTSQFRGSGLDDAWVVRAVEDSSGAFATLQVNTANLSWGSKMGPTWTTVAQIDGAHAGDDVSVQTATHLAHIHVGLLV